MAGNQKERYADTQYNDVPVVRDDVEHCGSGKVMIDENAPQAKQQDQHDKHYQIEIRLIAQFA